MGLASSESSMGFGGSSRCTNTVQTQASATVTSVVTRSISDHQARVCGGTTAYLFQRKITAYLDTPLQVR